MLIKDYLRLCVCADNVTWRGGELLVLFIKESKQDRHLMKWEDGETEPSFHPSSNQSPEPGMACCCGTLMADCTVRIVLD